VPVAFRMDDITPGMNWQRFEQFVALFDAHGVKPLLGVVPENHDPKLEIEPQRASFWDIMRALRDRGWSFAQHGYQHVYVNRDPGLLGVSRNSEFAGVRFAEQRDKIARGRALLGAQGLASDVWMAPSHSFDDNTLQALRETGFRVVTDGYAPFPYDRAGLRFVPCQMAFPRPIPMAAITVCIHANNTSDAYFARIERFLRERRRMVVDFDALRRMPARGVWNRSLERGVLRARALLRGPSQ
jgi:hypothetical protein